MKVFMNETLNYHACFFMYFVGACGKRNRVGSHDMRVYERTSTNNKLLPLLSRCNLLTRDMGTPCLFGVRVGNV